MTSFTFTTCVADRLPKRAQRGLSVIEIFVALTLIGTGLSLSASLIVRHGRLVAGQREYRMALDELSNQLERLAGLPTGELLAAIERLEVSGFAAAHLADAKLQGEVKPIDVGQQLTLSITWDGRDKTAAPSAPTMWLPGKAEACSAESEGSQP